MRITRGEIKVFTFKSGLLSRLGHDLRLSLGRFEIETDPDSGEVEARFWTTSLTVDGAMSNGRLDPGELSDKDKRDIQGNAHRKVLKVDRHPTATFRGRFTGDADGDGQVDGALELMGRSARIQIPVRRAGDRLTGEVELVPTRWGIAPFSALMGAIKLKDQVLVRFELTSG